MIPPFFRSTLEFPCLILAPAIAFIIGMTALSKFKADSQGGKYIIAIDLIVMSHKHSNICMITKNIYVLARVFI